MLNICLQKYTLRHIEVRLALDYGIIRCMKEKSYGKTPCQLEG